MNRFQLCEARETLPVSDDYIYEIKFDGERVLVIKKGDDVEIWNRNRKNNELGFLKNSQYPEIVEELKRQKHDFILDGEVACADHKKRLNELNRRALQTDDMKIKLLVKLIPIKLYVFDVLEVDYKLVWREKLIERKKILAEVLEKTEHIEAVEFWFNGKELWKIVVDEDLEGLVAKRKDGIYQFKRTDEWVKVKLVKETEVSCIGYNTNSGRSPFGSMITNKGNVSLLTEENKKFYLENKPQKAVVKHYGIYPSGKMRNPVWIKWCEN